MGSNGFPFPYGECEYLRAKTGIAEVWNPIEAGQDVWRGLSLTSQCYREVYQNSTKGPIFEPVVKFASDFKFFLGFVSIQEVATVVGMAAMWTIARYILSGLFFKPLARWLCVLPKNIDKFAESSWKCSAYLGMWLYVLNVVFFRQYDFFQNPMQQFRDWTTSLGPFDLTLIYGLELSFYLHSVYATLYMDAWRKDSIVMMTHHFVSMTLISFSYVLRCMKVGVMIFCLNDIGDILLESGKVATYLRHRTTGYFSPFFDAISNLTAVLFAVTWVTNRLWGHLIKIWRPAALGIWASHPVLPLPFHLFFNFFLGILYAFYIYWFWFIVVFVIRIVSGKSGSAEDPREDENAKTKPGKKPAKLE